MGNLYITVEDFMNQIGSSLVDVEPNIYGGAAMQISNASVSYNDEEEELTFYYGCNASLTLKTDNIEHIVFANNVDDANHVEKCYLISLHEDALMFMVTMTPEIK